MTRDRLLTTTGIQKGETQRAETIERNMSRPNTTTEYTGNASYGNSSVYIDGVHNEPHRNQLESYPIVGAGASGKGMVLESDYGIKSKTAYPNNRTENKDGGYFGAMAGSLGAAVAPILDVLKPSRKENAIGNLRPYENAKASVSKSYYYDPKELKNILISENEIFNTPYNIEVINHDEEKKLYTKLNMSFIKLQIENIYDYKNDIKLGSAALFFNKVKSSINYKIDKNIFEFNYFDDSDKKKFLYNGKFNLKPFYSNLEGDAKELNVSYLFGTNAIIAELLKTEIFNNKNLDFKLNINANRIKNSRNFINLFLKSKIQDGLIDIDGTRVEWKDNSIIKLTNTLIFVKDGKLFLDGKSKIDITNFKNIYKFLLTPKNFRKKIKTIDFSFSYVFSEKVIILNDIIIDGKYNQKVNEKLNNIYFRGSDMQNKIFFKNMTNDLLKAYAG